MSLDSLNNITYSNVVTQPPTLVPNDFGLGVDVVVIMTLIGLLILSFFIVLNKYVLPLLKNSKSSKKTKLLAFRVETAVWFVFALFTITQFLTSNFIITAGLLAVIGLVGFNFARNFFPGLIFRLSNKFIVGDLVKFEGYSGEITKLGVTTITIRSADEERIYLPYNKLNSGVFVKRQAKGKLMSSKIILQIGAHNPSDIVEKVSKWIYECPWAIPQQKNVATVQPGGLLNVTVYAVDERSLGKVERYIKERIETPAEKS